MRKFLLIACMLILFHDVFSQEELIKRTTKTIDSLITLIDKERDEQKRLELVLAIYTTASEGFPAILLETSQKLYMVSQKNKDIISEASSWSFAGQGYRLSGDFIKALECHLKAVALAEKSGNPSLLGNAQNQMAHIYKEREENEKALFLYRAAAANIAKGNIRVLDMWPMMNLGAVYLSINELDSSLYYSQRTYEMCLKYHLPYLSYILGNIGSVYSKRGDNVKARKYYDMAMEMAEKSLSARVLSNIYMVVAEHYYRNKNMDSCILYAKKTVAAVQNTLLVYLSIKPAKMLMDIYSNSNADSTLKYLKIYTAASDSLFSTRANQQLQMMTFEEDRRQQELATQKINYENKIRMNLMLTGLAMLLLIALILYRNSRQRKKANVVLEKTLVDLKSTQAQLVQSEKMASLGELTAGIAHEIQNPLNFVNNFSEVNTELSDELELEAEKGNMDEVKAIIKDIKENSSKINHHGKRADAIVKGMLQHSQASVGKKEDTDINALADEYLRLAYHGLRARDNSFNANMKVEFDKSIGKIQIVPQDMGRVILNLITNAFYAVGEKKKQQGGNYEPTVSVSTKKLNNKIEIKIADNGNGIPQKIINKIFQPFFTTKPTGQGTGLGLSLAYDVVKVHSGELKVETKEGEGSEFIIQLPV